MTRRRNYSEETQGYHQNMGRFIDTFGSNTHQRKGIHMRSIFIEARQWHDRTYGNSYYSAQVFIDGEHIMSTGISYGYEYQYEHDVARELIKLELLPDTCDSGYSMRRYCRDNGIDFYSVKYDTPKRELFPRHVRNVEVGV
jgi:hypothetical protein